MKKLNKFFLVALAVGVIGPGVVWATSDLNSSAQPNSNTTALNETELTCVKTALAKREATVLSAVEAQNSAWKTALQARSEALGKAWELPTKKERKAAQEKAWSNFQLAQKNARTAYKSSRNSAWSTYKTERKACGKIVVNSDINKESADALSL